MKRSKKIKIAVALLGGVLLSTLGGPVLANSRSNIRQGLPGRRISGGSRSPSTACLLNHANLQENQKVIAIAPENNLSRTATPHPTFWFALPAINTDRSIEFSLMNQDEEVVYTQTLQPTGKNGLTAISLPKTAPDLEENQTYKWHLSVVCDRDSRATDLVVWGWVERTASQPLSPPVAQANGLALQAGTVWNDTLTEIFNLHRDRTAQDQNTADLEEKWTALLAAENLLTASPIASLTSFPVETTGTAFFLQSQ